jgi:multidrug efflux pump subunit AcrA (membrane-fusion protein)
MTPFRFFSLLVAFLVAAVSIGQGLAQSKSPACGPDHAIIYKRSVALLDKAEKKLNDKYTAEAKALVKEANSLFSILFKECAPAQRERELTEKELQQEAINKKFSEDALAQAERLMKSAEDKEKKSQQAEAQGQTDLSVSYQRQAKSEYERAHALSIKAEIYALRNQEMIFRFLSK